MEGLADLEAARGNLERAEAIESAVLDLRRRQLAFAHPLVSTSLARLAIFQRRRGDIPAAIASFREALAMELQYRSALHPAVLGLIAVIDTLEGRSGSRSAAR